MTFPSPTYYDILSLSPSTLSQTDPATTSALIKRAYRRALLNHHPDKKKPTSHPQTQQPQQPPNQSSLSTSTSTYTIDQISSAYATLSLPALRQAYDHSLLLLSQSQPQQGRGKGTEFQTGIETIDLDDLDCEDYHQEEGEEVGEGTRTRWYRACRCGNPRGYLFTEEDLEDAADLGELMVGCADCSLWLRVHFAVVDDEDGGEEEGGGGTEGAAGDSAGTGAGKR